MAITLGVSVGAVADNLLGIDATIALAAQVIVDGDNAGLSIPGIGGVTQVVDLTPVLASVPGGLADGIVVALAETHLISEDIPPDGPGQPHQGLLDGTTLDLGGLIEPNQP